MTKTEKIKEIQGILGVKQDGHWGPLTQGALDDLLEGKVKDGEVHRVIATSFADPEDVAVFKKCKRDGGFYKKGKWYPGSSDSHCFKVGDNGKGCWGDSTQEGTGPCCALPPEDMEETWGSVNAAHMKRVEVVANNQTVVVQVKDRMPHRKNIKNGAGIDLNPDACERLGLNPPVKTPATWEALIEV